MPQDARTETLVIIGSGPAAWTAAVYAARANLDPLVIEGEPSRDMIPGGQLMYTTDIENFPGFPEGVDGQDLMLRMKEQAERFGTRTMMENVASVDFSTYPFVLRPSYSDEIRAKSRDRGHGRAGQLAGAGERDPPGAARRRRERLRGVRRRAAGLPQQASWPSSAAATRPWKRPTTSPSSPARWSSSTAATSSAPAASWPSAPWPTPRSASSGTRRWWRCSATTSSPACGCKDTVTGEEREMEVGGLFVAIGHTPNTAFLARRRSSSRRTATSWRRTPWRTATSVDGVFAAGDVMDDYYRQAITAAGTGCMAALEAERWLAHHGVSEAEPPVLETAESSVGQEQMA